MTGRKEDTDFRNLITKFGKEYNRGEKLSMLKFCLKDILPQSDFDVAIGADLLNKLKEQGIISYHNVTILSEISDVTRIKDAKKLVRDYKKNHKITEQSAEKKLSVYRTKLIAALKEVSTRDKETVIAHYQLDRNQFQTIWDIVLYLEQHKMVEENNVKQFIDLLNKSAQGIFQHLYPQPSATDNEAFEGAGEGNRQFEEGAPNYQPSQIPAQQHGNAPSDGDDYSCCDKGCDECTKDDCRFYFLMSLIILGCLMYAAAMVTSYIFNEYRIFGLIMHIISAIMSFILMFYMAYKNVQWLNRRNRERRRRERNLTLQRM